MGEGLTTPQIQKLAYYGASDLASSCENGNEPSGSIKGGKFLE
jgi:hypothetical protein